MNHTRSRHRRNLTGKLYARSRRNFEASLIERLESRQLLSAAYSVTPIPGNPLGQVEAFNDAGQTAGALATGNTGFFYSNGKTTTFSTNEGSSITITGMNASGQVIGYSTIQSVGGDSNVAFLYSGGNLTFLPEPATTISSTPVAINNAGTIAVNYELQNSIFQGYIDSNGKLADIGTLGGQDSVIMGMNNSEQIVGYSNLAGGNTHAFLYGGGKMTDIDPGGGIYSEADKINDAGDVVGSDDGGAFAILGGNLNHIEPPMGGTLSDIFLSTSGEVVGHAVEPQGGNDDLFIVTADEEQDAGGIPGASINLSGLNSAGTIIGYSTNIKTGVVAPFVYVDGRFQTISETGSSNVPLQRLEFINGSGQVIADNGNVNGKVNSYVLNESGWISGTVFYDTNHDGIENGGDIGAQAITVYLDPNYNHKLDAGEQSVVTDSFGNYTFTNPPADPEIVRIVLAANDRQTFPASGVGEYVGKNTGHSLTGENFAYYQFTPATASIAGVVFNDVNGDGRQNDGEVGIPGATVYIDEYSSGKFQAGDPSVVTNANGGYAFTDLTAGVYYVRVMLPPNSTQIYPPFNDAIPAFLGPGDTYPSADFAIQTSTTRPPVTISGTVFNDVNGDGAQDNNETGLAGVTVYEDPNYNHKLDAGEQSVVTDASGHYAFTDLPADPEILRIVLPNGSVQTAPANNVGIYVGKNITTSLTGENFGVHAPIAATGIVSGTVFNDLNGDHVYTPSTEPVQSGIVAFVDYNHNGALDAGEPSAASGSNGQFTISGVAPGTWYVDVVTVSNGYRRTLPVAGTNSYRVTVTAKNTASIGFFGVTTSAYVGGTLFNDKNGNGVQDPGESGLAGWTVYLDLNNDGIHQSNEPVAQTVTTSGGYWYFRAVAPGTYTIRAIAPTGYTITHACTVTLTSGEMVINGAISAQAS
ncbi:MAG TPA: SdrD B-like domain-containing protein [Tepidisphaeraceae bacterium]|nr:SdrD B-like domain-containing protein [Tepidisphaeraceae bacterium]